MKNTNKLETGLVKSAQETINVKREVSKTTSLHYQVKNNIRIKLK